MEMSEEQRWLVTARSYGRLCFLILKTRFHNILLSSVFSGSSVHPPTITNTCQPLPKLPPVFHRAYAAALLAAATQLTFWPAGVMASIITRTGPSIVPVN
jgi:hypothetical protein